MEKPQSRLGMMSPYGHGYTKKVDTLKNMKHIDVFGQKLKKKSHKNNDGCKVTEIKSLIFADPSAPARLHSTLKYRP